MTPAVAEFGLRPRTAPGRPDAILPFGNSRPNSRLGIKQLVELRANFGFRSRFGRGRRRRKKKSVGKAQGRNISEDEPRASRSALSRTAPCRWCTWPEYYPTCADQYPRSGSSTWYTHASVGTLHVRPILTCAARVQMRLPRKNRNWSATTRAPAVSTATDRGRASGLAGSSAPRSPNALAQIKKELSMDPLNLHSGRQPARRWTTRG
jgi:hypothetical protein